MTDSRRIVENVAVYNRIHQRLRLCSGSCGCRLGSCRRSGFGSGFRSRSGSIVLGLFHGCLSVLEIIGKYRKREIRVILFLFLCIVLCADNGSIGIDLIRESADLVAERVGQCALGSHALVLRVVRSTLLVALRTSVKYLVHGHLRSLGLLSLSGLAACDLAAVLSDDDSVGVHLEGQHSVVRDIDKSAVLGNAVVDLPAVA